MEVLIGADYKGFERKQSLLRFLAQQGHNVTDVGAYEIADGDDYNDPAVRVAAIVREQPEARGILICGSAHGMTIQANRFKGVRAAHCDSPESARLAREHDDANVLCLSAEFLDNRAAEEVAKAFLETSFTPIERRVRRINRLDERNDYA